MSRVYQLFYDGPDERGHVYLSPSNSDRGSLNTTILSRDFNVVECQCKNGQFVKGESVQEGERRLTVDEILNMTPCCWHLREIAARVVFPEAFAEIGRGC